MAATVLLVTSPLLAGASNVTYPASESGHTIVAATGVRSAPVASKKARETPAQILDRLVAELADVQSRLDAAEAAVVAITARRHQIGPDIIAARARSSAAAAAVKPATTDVTTTRAQAKEAKAEQGRAAAARTAAAAVADQAAKVDESARTRLEVVSEQADAARVAVKRAETKVDKAKGKSRDEAFSAWQMAAISDRFGHARTVLAKQQAAEAARLLAESSAVLAAAVDAQTSADDTLTRADAAAKAAAEHLAAAKAENGAATKELAALKAERPQLKVDLAKATNRVTRLRQERVVLTRQVARARTQLAAAGTASPQVTP